MPPDVDLTGSNNGRPVPHGSPVTLTCVPLAGQPEPTLRVEPSRGYRQPVGTTSRRVGSNIVLTIPSLTADVCFDCEGTSPVGQDVDQECLTILRMYSAYLACCLRAGEGERQLLGKVNQPLVFPFSLKLLLRLRNLSLKLVLFSDSHLTTLQLHAVGFK